MSRYVISTHAQGTPEWLADRLGKVTGSPVAALYKKARKGESAARATYRTNLVLERLHVEGEAAFQSKAMKWGSKTEGRARLTFEADTGLPVREAGFCALVGIPAGASVDGFIDEEPDRLGILEIKCPTSKVHLAYLRAGVLPPEHAPQVLHNLWVTGAQFARFMSYDPRMPEGLRTFYVHIERDEAAIAAHEALVLPFIAEVDSLESQLRQRAA